MAEKAAQKVDSSKGQDQLKGKGKGKKGKSQSPGEKGGETEKLGPKPSEVTAVGEKNAQQRRRLVDDRLTYTKVKIQEARRLKWGDVDE